MNESQDKKYNQYLKGNESQDSDSLHNASWYQQQATNSIVTDSMDNSSETGTVPIKEVQDNWLNISPEDYSTLKHFIDNNTQPIAKRAEIALKFNMTLGKQYDNPITLEKLEKYNNKSANKYSALLEYCENLIFNDNKNVYELLIEERINNKEYTKINIPNVSIDLTYKVPININGQHPLAYAILNDKKIYNQNALKWAVSRGVPIEGEEPLKWAIKNNVKVKITDLHDKNKFTLVDPVQYVIDKKIRIAVPGIGLMDPRVYAIMNDLTIERQQEISEPQSGNKYIDQQKQAGGIVNDMQMQQNLIKEKIPVVQYLREKNIKIPKFPRIPILKYFFKKDALAWAIDKKKKINNQDPIEWAIQNKQRIGNKSIGQWLVSTGKKTKAEIANIVAKMNDENDKDLFAKNGSVDNVSLSTLPTTNQRLEEKIKISEHYQKSNIKNYKFDVNKLPDNEKEQIINIALESLKKENEGKSKVQYEDISSLTSSILTPSIDDKFSSNSSNFDKVNSDKNEQQSYGKDSEVLEIYRDAVNKQKKQNEQKKQQLSNDQESQKKEFKLLNNLNDVLKNNNVFFKPSFSNSNTHLNQQEANIVENEKNGNGKRILGTFTKNILLREGESKSSIKNKSLL